MFKTEGQRMAVVIVAFLSWAIGTAIIWGFRTSTMLIYAALPFVIIGALWCAEGQTDSREG